MKIEIKKWELIFVTFKTIEKFHKKQIQKNNKILMHKTKKNKLLKN